MARPTVQTTFGLVNVKQETAGTIRVTVINNGNTTTTCSVRVLFDDYVSPPADVKNVKAGKAGSAVFKVPPAWHQVRDPQRADPRSVLVEITLTTPSNSPNELSLQEFVLKREPDQLRALGMPSFVGQQTPAATMLATPKPGTTGGKPKGKGKKAKTAAAMAAKPKGKTGGKSKGKWKEKTGTLEKVEPTAD